MENRWTDIQAKEYLEKYGNQHGNDLAARVYASRLIGMEKQLVLHGGGNTSVKSTITNVCREEIPVIFVKASGMDLATITPRGHVALELEPLKKLAGLETLPDNVLSNELMKRRINAHAPSPSLEALMHVFIPCKYVDHTHADSILALTNQVDGENLVREVFKDAVIVLQYVKPGFELAKAVLESLESSSGTVKGIILMKHGLITWGDTAKESYGKTIELVTKAETVLAGKKPTGITVVRETSIEQGLDRYVKIAPILRGAMAIPTGDQDWPFDRFILEPLITPGILNMVDSNRLNDVLLTPPITSDHLIRTKPFPMVIRELDFDDETRARTQVYTALEQFGNEYGNYIERNKTRMDQGLTRFDSKPRVIIIPGMGVVCAGKNAKESRIVKDITVQTFKVKSMIPPGKYEGLTEEHLFDMEYFSFQHAKLDRSSSLLERSVALITGAAGAIGMGIVQELLEQKCHVVITDLPGDHLDSVMNELDPGYADHVIAVPMDVTDPESVKTAFRKVIQKWGGVDLAIINAGIAHVASLEEMKLEDFRMLERVNIEGTLNVLSETSRHFRVQGTQGDVVVISTKNVFSPGARFGAYSATKAASHQLARIASLELASLGVRVNMVSPDAVFGHGTRRSGLWEEVGPDRMRARGLDEKGLEEYYLNRNLLKTKVTATHVANAVLYFATRQSPTTGATIPVDGGLPDSTPR